MEVLGETNAEEKFKSVTRLKSGTKVGRDKGRKPQVMVKGVEKGYTKENFVEELFKQNKGLSERIPAENKSEIEVASVRPARNEYKENWVLSLNGKAFRELVRAKRVTMDLESVRVDMWPNTARNCVNCERTGITEEERKHMASEMKCPSTRWSARADACEALYNSYDAFKQALEHIVKDDTQTPKTKAEGTGILKKMFNLETGIMLSFWNDLLTYFHKTSKSLQKENMDILTAINLYESLIKSVTSVTCQLAVTIIKSKLMLSS
ncbi:unnamed protein product [Brassicogethes aeneus]|uniref:Uncharacterized protein n=1 Tax=Brassicogethes aeneus TaxID=1431903 RepID=A0A9P0BJ16_BRAAE|nr:unnamed protein product [Brassicogethes aeneus]